MQLKTQTRGSFNVTEARTIVVLEETGVEVEVVVAVVLRETEVGIEINVLVMETVQGVVGSQSAAEYARTLQAAHTRRVLEHALHLKVVVEEDKEKHVEG